MATISIIGSGSMGTAIAALATKGGYDVQQLGRGTDGGSVDGDIVVLAVPYGALNDVVAEHGTSLAGKVVVDITNPVDFATMDGLVVDAGTSATAQLAEALPDSKVVKAFNTNFAGTLAGTVGSQTTTVLVAGDDVDAKSTVSALVTSGGLKAVDAGALKRAQELEALGLLQITLAAREQVSWAGGFGVQN
jgi:predicted dinucleotide-binding enzyme